MIPRAATAYDAVVAHRVTRLAEWCRTELQRPDLPVTAVGATTAALIDDGHTVRPVLGLEFHHDGSDRTDLSLFTREPLGRGLQIGDAGFDLGDEDVTEVDVAAPMTPRLAGIFHRVVAARLPKPLTTLPDPLFVSHLTGRAGELRLIVPVTDQDQLRAIIDVLRTEDAARPVLDFLGSAAVLLSPAGGLRVGIEYLPSSGRLGERVGVEIVPSQASRPPRSSLQAIGVPSQETDRMEELTERLPLMRRRATLRLQGPTPSPATDVDLLTTTHLSVTWRNGQTTLKTYALARSTPLDGTVA